MDRNLDGTRGVYRHLKSLHTVVERHHSRPGSEHALLPSTLCSRTNSVCSTAAPQAFRLRQTRHHSIEVGSGGSNCRLKSHDIADGSIVGWHELLADDRHRILQGIPAQMSVSLCGPRAGVAEQFRDQEQTRAVSHRKAGEAVPQIMNPNAFQTRSIARLREGASNTANCTNVAVRCQNV